MCNPQLACFSLSLLSTNKHFISSLLQLLCCFCLICSSDYIDNLTLFSTILFCGGGKKLSIYFTLSTGLSTNPSLDPDLHPCWGNQAYHISSQEPPSATVRTEELWVCLPHPGGDLQRACPSLQQHLHPVPENSSKKTKSYYFIYLITDVCFMCISVKGWGFPSVFVADMLKIFGVYCWCWTAASPWSGLQGMMEPLPHWNLYRLKAQPFSLISLVLINVSQ